MSNPQNPPRDARKKAQSHFDVAEARTTLVKRMVEAENTALDARTAKLRALRLAKEADDRAAAAADPQPTPAKKPRKKIVRA